MMRGNKELPVGCFRQPEDEKWYTHSKKVHCISIYNL